MRSCPPIIFALISLTAASCGSGSQNVVIANEYFRIPANQNIIYDKDHKTIKFLLDGKTHQVVQHSVDSLDSRQQVVDVKIVDINAEVYGHRTPWDSLKSSPDQNCEPQEVQGRTYFMCSKLGPAAYPDEYTIHEKGMPINIAIGCDLDSKLPNPICRVESRLFNSIGANYTFNSKYLHDVILIDTAIQKIAADLHHNSKGNSNAVSTDANSKRHY